MVWDDQVVSGNSIGVNFKDCRWLTWFSGREILCKEVIRRNRYGLGCFNERRINERGNNEMQCFTFPYNGCKAEIVCAYAGSLCKHTLGSPTSPTSPLSSNRYLTASWSSFLLPTFLSPHILGPLFASRKYHTLRPPPENPHNAVSSTASRHNWYRNTAPSPGVIADSDTDWDHIGFKIREGRCNHAVVEVAAGL